MSDEIDRLGYALSKQVPDMVSRGFVIGTSYGELEVSTEDAPEIVRAVQSVLERKYAAARAAQERI